jgi:hypothetical protein
MCPDGTISPVSDKGLNDRNQIPGRGRDIFIGTTPRSTNLASCQKDTAMSFSGGKAVGS